MNERLDDFTPEPRSVRIATALNALAGEVRDAGGDPARIDALLADIEALNAAQDSLAAREEQFRFTFEIATVGIAVVALDGRFVQVNRQLCDFLGYPPDVLMGLTFQEITHPDDLQADLHHVERLARGETASFSMEKRYIRGDGRIAWAGLSATVRRNAEGRPLYFVSVVDDIGERKAAEERQAFLLGELAHRSKNLIMVLQSLVRHTASGEASVDAFSRRLGDRLSALTASQDLLIGSEDEAVSMADLLARQMAAFLPPGDPRLSAEGPAVRLGSRAAQSLGLAFHELATNACKYGALSDRGGEVHVDWSVGAGEGDARMLHLQWCERGGPPVTPPTRQGFGARVIDGMVRSALGAEVELQFPPEGLCWRVTVSLANLARA